MTYLSKYGIVKATTKPKWGHRNRCPKRMEPVQAAFEGDLAKEIIVKMKPSNSSK